MKKSVSKNLSLIILITLLFSMCTTNVSAADTIVPFYFNLGLSGGDVAILSGAGFDNVKEVKGVRLNDDDPGDTPRFVLTPSPTKYYRLWENDKYKTLGITESMQSLTIFQKSEKGVNFLLPDTWEKGVYAITVYSTTGTANETVYLNQPIPEWTNSALGFEQCYPGGELRIQGKNLSLGDRIPRVAFVDATTEEVAATITDVVAMSPYSLKLTVPNSISHGKYKIYVHNGYGGETAWSEPLEFEVTNNLEWRNTERVFRVTDYGAKANDDIDDIEAITTAMAAAHSANGGIVYFPRGRYVVSETIRVPEFVTLKGAGKHKTQLFMDNVSIREEDKTADSPNATRHERLIEGTINFGVEDMELVLNYGRTCIGSTFKNDWSSERDVHGNIFILNNVFSTNNTGATSESDLGEDYRNNWLENMRWGTHGVFALASSAGNVHIEGNKFIGVPMGMNLVGPYSTLIGNEYIRSDHTGAALTGPPIGIANAIIENNKGLPTSSSVTQNGGDISSRGLHLNYNKYFANNTAENNLACDRELFTTDGGNFPIYDGAVEKVDGVKITLKNNLKVTFYEEDHIRLKDYAVFTHGDGTNGNCGQLRRFVDYDPETKTLTVDTPFDVDPTNLMIADNQSNFIFYDCNFEYGGVFGYYGRMLGMTVDNCYMRNMEGLSFLNQSTYNTNGYGGYINFINNLLEEHLITHWVGVKDAYAGINRSSGIIAYGRHYMYTQWSTYANTFRNNILRDNGVFIMSAARMTNYNTVFDKNSFYDGKEAFEITASGGNYESMLLYKNSFENVTNPYYFKGVEPGTDVTSRVMVID